MQKNVTRQKTADHKTRPNVSVLLPIFNTEKYLQHAIESVLTQTYSNFELIALNDGSTDNSIKIIKSFSDSRIITINNTINRGLIHTLNRGIKLAQGKYIARMDADDIAHPQRLEKQVQFLNENNTIALVGSCAEFIDDQGKAFMTCSVPLTHNEILSRIFTSNCFIHPSVMFRSTAIQTIGGYRLEALHAEDYDLWLRIIKYYQVANIGENLIQYRIHTNQISQNKLRQQRTIADQLRYSAFEEFKKTENISKNSTLPKHSIKTISQDSYPSVSTDYLSWIEIYKTMGRNDLANSMLLQALLNAPFCGSLYRELLKPITNNPSIQKLINTLNWYQKRIQSFVFREHL